MFKKWFVRLYIPMMMAVITAGMISVLVFGYKPSPALVIKPSNFDKPEEIGAVLFHRFYSDINSRKLIAFGIPPQPDWHQEILLGFLRAAAGEGKPFDAMISEAQMPQINTSSLSGLLRLSIPTNSKTNAELLDALESLKGKRILLHLPSVFSTHILENNVVHRLEKHLGEPVFSISAGPLALRPDQEFLVDPPCLGSERDGNGTSPLGCAILQAGRAYYRKQLPQEKYVALMNSRGPVDYLLMVSTPGQDNAGNEDSNRKLRMNAPGPAKSM